MKTPQERGTSDEEAEAMPVESEPAVAEIHVSQDATNSKREINTLDKTIKKRNLQFYGSFEFLAILLNERR